MVHFIKSSIFLLDLSITKKLCLIQRFVFLHPHICQVCHAFILNLDSLWRLLFLVIIVTFIFLLSKVLGLLIYSYLYQRKELCKLHGKLEQQKKGLLDIIADRKKFLSSLPSHLKSLKKASLPVQNQLGIQHTKKLKQHHLAELLPPPLYVLYSQFIAQKEAFGENIDLEIVGSVKDAQTFARQQANKDTGNLCLFILCNYLMDSD